MKLFYKILIISALLVCCRQGKNPIEIKTLANYPSASGIEYFDNSFYIIGDDAKSILILDNDLNIKDSILLYDQQGYRIPKETKPDLESITIVYTKKGYRLLVLGSGSLVPYRNTGWIIDPQTKRGKNFRLDTLYQKFTSLHAIREVNVEGLCALSTGILLASRGHLAYPENNLLFIESSYYSDLNNAVVQKIKLEKAVADTSIFAGVSGLAYSAKSDRLFLTLSTELTESTYKDGAIGKSYLWIINDLSKKIAAEKLVPDKIIELEKIDAGFTNRKIESVCIIAERKNEVQLAMVSENDDGASVIFRLTINPN